MASATQELTIAQAAFSASLFRADPTSVTRSSVDAFFPLLHAAVAQCSRPNVQKCRAWLVDHVAHSRARTAALGKYLVAASKSWNKDDGKKPSAKRRRLHVLYVLNDVLHHAITKQGNREFGSFWDGHLPSLVALSVFEKAPKHNKKLEELIGIWSEKAYFSQELVVKLKEAASNGALESAASADDLSAAATSVKLAKDAPYTLPSSHGDQSLPWYDLPAATWLPYLTPNSTKPMNPDFIRPIQLVAGPADKAVEDAVRSLLADVDLLFSKEGKLGNDPLVGINELGEKILLDEDTGEVVGGETYYGWSRSFCKKMKERKMRSQRGGEPHAERRSRPRSRSNSSGYSRGRSRSSSAPAFKRRRLSPGSRSRSRSRSYSPSPPRSSGRGPRGRSRSHSHSRSRSPGRSYRRRSYTRSSSRSRSRSPSRSPHRRRPSPPRGPPQPLPPQQQQQQQQQHYQHPHQQQQYPPPMPPNFPAIPPPPPGYTGPWPPPPPPPAIPPSANNGGPPQNWFPNPGMMPQMPGWNGSVPPPPPPPPYPQQYGNNNNYGRGRGRPYGGGGGRGDGYGYRGGR